MNIDAMVFEIGSTTTLVNAFDDLKTDSPKFLGQGQGETSVLFGDVRTGLFEAISDLEKKLDKKIKANEIFATSSAAGGLRMSVHGLVYDMTVRAAKAAALGAGAIIKMATAGKITNFDIDDIKNIDPNLILLCGGTDYGERETAIYNANLIAESGLNIPVIYAGNIQNQRQIEKIFSDREIQCTVTENIYPKLDFLNIEPCRKVIHGVFEEHIVKAPGMSNIKRIVNGAIMPTPGAVMEATQILFEELKDIVVIDIGGATTDVHSATEGSEEISLIQTSPEPFFKRTVEGDLGLFLNSQNIIDMIGDKLPNEINIDIAKTMKNYQPIPYTKEQLILTERLAVEAGTVALLRHAGKLRHIFSPSGRQTIAEGKDLTKIKYLIGTGGALTRLKDREIIARKIADSNKGDSLMPKPGEIKLLYDNDYIFASLGVLGTKYREAAKNLLMQSIFKKDNNAK
ncbi:MAG: GlmL-related ornithine degradation protein [Clostridia bacterium]